MNSQRRSTAMSVGNLRRGLLMCEKCQQHSRNIKNISIYLADDLSSFRRVKSKKMFNWRLKRVSVEKKDRLEKYLKVFFSSRFDEMIDSIQFSIKVNKLLLLKFTIVSRLVLQMIIFISLWTE